MTQYQLCSCRFSSSDVESIDKVICDVVVVDLDCPPRQYSLGNFVWGFIIYYTSVLIIPRCGLMNSERVTSEYDDNDDK